MARKSRPKTRRPSSAATASREEPTLRIIGGKFRGRKLIYNGDRRTRPMKDRVREAVFNLIGPSIRGKHAIDPFAGTGALALEALSRGAVRATMVEQHFPTARTIEQNIAALSLQDSAQVTSGDAFYWGNHLPELGDIPWTIFISPPYDFYVERTEEMLRLIGTLLDHAPPESVCIVETDEHFDFGLLPQAENWDVRRYYPAFVGILRCERVT